MKTEYLIDQIHQKKSFLCIGLDTDLDKIPKHLLKFEDPVFEFNKAIIEATHDLCVSFKPNTAFYEADGIKGWLSLKRTIEYLNENHPEIFTIADAKRGDIGNTAAKYAKAFFEEMHFDSITVAPYMGKDSVEPFLSYKNKHTILLALTSNDGAYDFQVKNDQGKKLYRRVIETARTWDHSDNLMFVIGATKAKFIQEVRKLAPNNFLLVPGVGAQGGSLQEVCEFGLNKDVGLLINASRSIIYASSKSDFAERAREEAQKMQKEMEEILHN